MIIDKKNFLESIDFQTQFSIELGCGPNKKNIDAVGIDLIDYDCVDIVGDVFEVLSQIPSESVKNIYTYHFLEHIEDRVTFLKSLVLTTKAKRYLIRVPMFERDWQMALRRELGVDFRSDPDHRIEHTIKEFREEICESGLDFYEMQTIWGEIWADCRVKKEVR